MSRNPLSPLNGWQFIIDPDVRLTTEHMFYGCGQIESVNKKYLNKRVQDVNYRTHNPNEGYGYVERVANDKPSLADYAKDRCINDLYAIHREKICAFREDGTRIEPLLGSGVQSVKGIGISAEPEKPKLTVMFQDMYGDDVCADVRNKK